MSFDEFVYIWTWWGYYWFVVYSNNLLKKLFGYSWLESMQRIYKNCFKRIWDWYQIDYESKSSLDSQEVIDGLNSQDKQLTVNLI